MGMFDGLFGGGSDVDVPDPNDLMRQMEEYNRVNTTTPFGSIKYTKDGPQPMSFGDWQTQNPSPATSSFNNQFTQNSAGVSPNNYNARDEYDSYVSGLGQGRTTAGFEFSPELQSMFDKQFDPNAYDIYKNDYMGNYTDLMAPLRDDQLDRFQQGMFNRGQPEGGELYGDVYRDTIGDPNARQDLMAATQAQQASDVARLQDYNRLMAAMGGSQLPIPNIDVMGAQNLSMNADFQNQANESSIWDTMPTLASAYMIGAPSDSWLWG